VHPHLQTVVETKRDIDRVVENSDVMWCLDTGHMTIGGQDTVEFAKKYSSRVGHVHLKDVNMKSVPPVLARQQSIMEGVQKGLFTPLGQGDVPILETILALESAGYQGWYVIEQDVAITGEMRGVGEGPITGMKQSVDYLHNVAAPAVANLKTK
jgi:inosose dehydratase